MEVDLIPLLDYAVGLAAVVITAIIGIVGKKLNERFNLENEDRHRVVLQEALGYGVLFAMNKAKETYKDAIPFRVKSEIVGKTINYMIDSAPDALKKFGIDPNTREGTERIKNMIEARIDTRVFGQDEAKVVKLHAVDDKEPA